MVLNWQNRNKYARSDGGGGGVVNPTRAYKHKVLPKTILAQGPRGGGSYGMP